jgi:nucleoside-diphosphate-sugar epimerase
VQEVKIIVTGAGGNVARWILRRLANESDLEIIAYDLVQGEEHPNVRWVTGDVLDPDALATAMEGCEMVVHLAAIPVYMEDRELDIGRINILGVQTALDAAMRTGVRRFIQASSICATGFIFTSEPLKAPYLPVDESYPTKPDDMYGVSKLVCEQLAYAYEKRYGIETTSYRMASVWDPESELSKHEVAHMLKAEVDDDMVYADLRWAYVDVRDVAEAYALALRHPSGLGVCNVGAADTPGGDNRIWLEDMFPGTSSVDLPDTGAPIFSIKKLQDEAGYSPAHTWEEYPAFLEEWPNYLERRGTLSRV